MRATAAAAELERRGLLTGLITQNVDRLHEEAGSLNVVDLHGRFDQVVCLDCRRTYSRRLLAGMLEELNPGFLEHAMESGLVEIAPDADSTVEDSDPDRQLRGGSLPCVRRHAQA